MKGRSMTAAAAVLKARPVKHIAGAEVHRALLRPARGEVRFQRAIQRDPFNGRQIHELKGINDSINAKQLIQTNGEGQALTKFLGGKQQMNKAIMQQARRGY